MAPRGSCLTALALPLPLPLLQEHGIEPVATLHHFVHPLWWEKVGGFDSGAALHHFVTYCEKVFERFGSRIRLWLTINEVRWPVSPSSLLKRTPTSSSAPAIPLSPWSILSSLLPPPFLLPHSVVSHPAHPHHSIPISPARPPFLASCPPPLALIPLVHTFPHSAVSRHPTRTTLPYHSITCPSPYPWLDSCPLPFRPLPSLPFLPTAPRSAPFWPHTSFRVSSFNGPSGNGSEVAASLPGCRGSLHGLHLREPPPRRGGKLLQGRDPVPEPPHSARPGLQGSQGESSGGAQLRSLLKKGHSTLCSFHKQGREKGRGDGSRRDSSQAKEVTTALRQRGSWSSKFSLL